MTARDEFESLFRSRNPEQAHCEVCGVWESIECAPEGKGAQGQIVCSECYLLSPGAQMIGLGKRIINTGRHPEFYRISREEGKKLIKRGKKMKVQGRLLREDEAYKGIPERRKRRVGEKGGPPLSKEVEEWLEMVLAEVRKGNATLVENMPRRDRYLDCDLMPFVHVELRNGGGFRHTMMDTHADRVSREIAHAMEEHEGPPEGGLPEPVQGREPRTLMTNMEKEHCYFGAIPVTVRIKDADHSRRRDCDKRMKRKTLHWRVDCDADGQIEEYIFGVLPDDVSCIAMKCRLNSRKEREIGIPRKSFDDFVRTGKVHHIVYEIMEDYDASKDCEAVAFNALRNG